METKKLNGNQLKLIAILAMTVDHLTWALFPGYDRRWFVIGLHLVGRITAPIMWFFIAEGYYHTRSVRKYGLRLFALAFVSHFAYAFFGGRSVIPLQSGIFDQTGVVWSLAWGLVLLKLDESTLEVWKKLVLTLLICLITFPADWSCIAAMAVMAIGSNRGDFGAQMRAMLFWTALYAGVYAVFLDPLYGLLQLGTCLAVPLLRLYNGQRGKSKWVGKLFYIYYPAHLALLGGLRLLLT